MNSIPEVVVRAHVNPAMRTVDFWIRTVEGDLCCISDMRFEKVASGSEMSGPALRLTPENAQLLMDSLWECGLRPQADVGTAGQLEATRDHLLDLQRIVFKQLRIKP